MSERKDSYTAALEFILERSHLARGYITTPALSSSNLELGLHRTRAVLDELGAPDRALPIVHIAGSKGKGSTAAFADSIGRSAGYRAGLSTSPHLHSYRERIVIDGVPISPEDFARVASEVQRTVLAFEQRNPNLGSITAFEILTVMALLAFAEAACDLAIVEVGLGGMYDSTNVVVPAVSVITRLDLEHTNILGDTLAEIAKNKAGIIKPGVPCISAPQERSALQVIEEVARRNRSSLRVAGRDFWTSGAWPTFTWSTGDQQITELRTGMAGDHQVENASLAIAAWESLAQVGLRATEDAVRQGLRRASLPGRYEQIELEQRTWILDGAHTPAAAAALAELVLEEFGQPVYVIAGMLRDKHPAPFFEALAPAVDRLIVTTPKNPRAIAAPELLLIASAVNPQVIARNDLETAISTAITDVPVEHPIVITGSFTLVAEAREHFGLAIPER